MRNSVFSQIEGENVSNYLKCFYFLFPTSSAVGLGDMD